MASKKHNIDLLKLEHLSWKSVLEEALNEKVMQQKRQLLAKNILSQFLMQAAYIPLLGYKYSFSKCCCSKWYEDY